MEDDKTFSPHKQILDGLVKFDVPENDVILIGIAVTRFMDFLVGRGVKVNKNHAQNLHMDLGACHCNGTPLDFTALNAMDLTPFVEDLIGIGKNMDRNTGKLLNGYRPRCAVARVN